jgi:hypothetical protein
LEEREIFLGLSEVDGHLELLHEDGAVEQDSVKDQLVFHRI